MADAPKTSIARLSSRVPRSMYHAQLVLFAHVRSTNTFAKNLFAIPSTHSWYYCDIEEDSDDEGGLNMKVSSAKSPSSGGSCNNSSHDHVHMHDLAPASQMRRTVSAPPAPHVDEEDDGEWDPVLAALMRSVGGGSGY